MKCILNVLIVVRELLATQPITTLSWVAPSVPQKKHSSKVSVLVSDELQDDSSGDEYVPAEEEVIH